MKMNSRQRTKTPELSDICLLVPSWDGYQDLWHPFFHCFFKYWPDCPFPIYLGANDASYDDPRVQMVRVPLKTDYSSSLMEFLKQTPSNKVIVWVEDLILEQRVNTGFVNQILQWAELDDVGHIRLWPNRRSLVGLAASFYPQADKPYMGMIPKKIRYRAGLTVGFWKKDLLLELLRPGESAWDFEMKGSERSNMRSEPFYCLIGDSSSPPPISVVNSVRKGLWTLEGIDLLRREGLLNFVGKRGIESKLTSLYLREIKQPATSILFRVLYTIKLRETSWP